jgi:hypothetical protein
MPTRVAVARTLAEPVFCVNHQISANWTRALPNREKACPVQIVKKRAAQLSGREWAVGSVIFGSRKLEHTLKDKEVAFLNTKTFYSFLNLSQEGIQNFQQ